MIKNIIAAVRTDEDFEAVLSSDLEKIFMLDSNILTVEFIIKKAHEAGKKVFIHIDFAEGIGKDKYGLMFLKQCGVDGIISTRTNIIKLAKEVGLYSVQRFFIVDSHSVKTTVESVRVSKADMIEVMPCTVTKVIARLKQTLDMPIIAGGLIESYDDINAALENGAGFVSTSDKAFWETGKGDNKYGSDK